MPSPLPQVVAPRPPELPPARRFPLIATLAPILASVVLFAITRSAFTLAFALLGPVVAVAATADAAMHSRRTRKSESARFSAELASGRSQVDRAHDAERLALNREFPTARRLVASLQAGASSWRPAGGAALAAAIRIGSGERASALVPASAPIVSSSRRGDDYDSQVEEFRFHASRLGGAPVTAEVVDGIGLVGSPTLTGSIVRGFVLQLAARSSPESVRIVAPADPSWNWIAGLPHAIARSGAGRAVTFVSPTSTVTLASAESAGRLPAHVVQVIEVRGSGSAHLASGPDAQREFVPEFVSEETARELVEQLAAWAERTGIGAAASGLPDEVSFAQLSAGDGESEPGLSAVVGVTSGGNLVLDLVEDGPHAIIGGTTGSGKSELLITWVLGMAAARSPEDVTFLFVDFKGGAAFDPLLALPHCAGVITDLDADQSLRALTSLGAELRHRERLLAAEGLRSIDAAIDAPPFPRLVVVVDEYAALVETHGSLHGVFADIAARGRSLGVHLVLCTQRPAGVVRDSILANCALRLSLRVMAASDSTAVLGSDAAAALPVRPVGRALVSVAGGAAIPFQVARAQPADGARIIERWTDMARPRVPWLPPLAAIIPITDPPAEAGAPGSSPDAPQLGDDVPFGIEDVPEQQSQPTARYRPASQGSLLVVGAAGSGKSGVLDALALAHSTTHVTRLPTPLPQLWDSLEALRGAGQTGARQCLVLLDDLDAIVASCDENYRPALLELLTELLRDGPANGIHCAITAQRISGAIQAVVALCGALLVLRMPNRQEHVLAGGVGLEFSDALPPGGGHWNGHRVQVFATERAAIQVPPPVTTVLDVRSAHVAAVSSRPAQFATRLRQLAPSRRVVVLGEPQSHPDANQLTVSLGGAPDILVADPDRWQTQWSALASALRSGDMLFDGCSLAELRAITRSRELPPPFARGHRCLWVRHPDGVFARASLSPEGER